MENRDNRPPNHLAGEKSPYLLQHQFNPVDWYPWGDEAFQKARMENKPVFLSIGYATCHWCHVMAHESFEDEDVARFMNETFVSVKVDREERPDIDAFYMSVCQMMTGAGGWPLTIIMTPDRQPFFAGTYFPKETRYGRPGMLDLVAYIRRAWNDRRDELLESAEGIVQALQRETIRTSNKVPGDETLHLAFRQLQQRFDKEWGGFGDAPKFPTPHNLMFLLRYWDRTGNEDALAMVETTLQTMRRGGVYDHVGFGFHRYSTDRQWLVPHFEKMLYDQALLALAYLEAYQVTRNEDYARTAREIFTYVLRDMTDMQGGFYSAEDADSEGVEGKFYLWTREEVQAVLPEEDFEIARDIFQLRKDGNVREEAAGRTSRENILHMAKPLSETAADLGMTVEDLTTRLDAIRAKLLDVRSGRVRPFLDDKILTDWNGLMIAALAFGGRVLDEPTYLAVAGRAADFILERMTRPDGILLHRFRDGQAGIDGQLDDYAFIIYGLFELYEATFEVKWLRQAIDLTTKMQELFGDDDQGGFFGTSVANKDLPVRQKQIYDGAAPSGNSVAALDLVRLGRLTGDTRLEGIARKIIEGFSVQVNEAPSAYTFLMLGVMFMTGVSREVVVCGVPENEDTRKMVRALNGPFFPNLVAVFLPANQSRTGIDEIIGYVQEYRLVNQSATAYVCVKQACQQPTMDIETMLKEIRSG